MHSDKNINLWDNVKDCLLQKTKLIGPQDHSTK